jgi:hypothetical protein
MASERIGHGCVNALHWCESVVLTVTPVVMAVDARGLGVVGTSQTSMLFHGGAIRMPISLMSWLAADCLTIKLKYLEVVITSGCAAPSHSMMLRKLMLPSTPRGRKHAPRGSWSISALGVQRMTGRCAVLSEPSALDLSAVKCLKP